MPTWLFGLKEAEGRKRRMVRAAEGNKKFQCTRCCVKRPKVGEGEP